MRIKYALIGIVLAAVPVTASANFIDFIAKGVKQAGDFVTSVAKQVKTYDDNSRARSGKGILSERDRARVDAVTTSGIGGKLLTGAAIATSVYGQIAKKDVSSAIEVLDNATTNYNSNNDVIEEKGWNSDPNVSSAINAFYTVGAAAYTKSKEKDIEKANEAFIENNKRYTDPDSPSYDPYFFETLKYDKNGRITGRMDTYDRVTTIKALNEGKNSVDWETIFQRTAAKYSSEEDRESYIEENREELEKEALAEMAQRRKENMENYCAGKYNEPQSQSESTKESEGKSTEPVVEASLPASIIISGYALNVVELSAAMEAQLDEALGILSKNPNYNITIIGNTCDLGNDRINNLKGEQRAENAKGYLVNKGIAESRIAVVSEGASKPMVKNSSVENRKLNRRIEIVFNK